MDGPYFVVKCMRCGELRVTKAAKRFKCFACGYMSTISKESLLARASSASEARQVVGMLKAETRRSSGSRPPKHL